MRIGSERRAGRALLALALLLAGAGCPNRPQPPAATPPAEVRPPAAPQVIFFTRAGETVTVRVELARTPAQREQGLMYRKELAPDAGMLFTFPEEGYPVFWMKNTLIPLDMIFINAAREVVGIVARAKPESLERLAVDRPAKYVLEVNAGFCDLHHIERGDRMQWVGVEE